ncbi:MAG: hypothetical protein ACXVNQ_09755 [Bacteroidia bacterium]
MKSKINAEWHRKHKMPAHPSFEQRVKWHLVHQKHCSCRPIDGKLADEMKRRGIEIPAPKLKE